MNLRNFRTDSSTTKGAIYLKQNYDICGKIIYKKYLYWGDK